jgi:hypothetical protein
MPNTDIIAQILAAAAPFVGLNASDDVADQDAVSAADAIIAVEGVASIGFHLDSDTLNLVANVELDTSECVSVTLEALLEAGPKRAAVLDLIRSRDTRITNLEDQISVLNCQVAYAQSIAYQALHATR